MCCGGVILQFSLWVVKVERPLSHWVPLEQLPELLVPLNVSCKRYAFPKGMQSLVGLSCGRHREGGGSAWSREGSAGLVFCFVFPTHPVALPNSVVWLLQGVSCRRCCVRVSMAVGGGDSWGCSARWLALAHLLGCWQPRHRGGSRFPFPFLFSSWSSGYCLYESELCVREL